jgi:hypothetical protein
MHNLKITSSVISDYKEIGINQDVNNSNFSHQTKGRLRKYVTVRKIQKYNLKMVGMQIFAFVKNIFIFYRYFVSFLRILQLIVSEPPSTNLILFIQQ